MILLIDNYDSFSYNLVQFFGTVEPDIKVVRNDECTIDEIRAMKPTHIILSPGPGYPKDAGICEEVIGQLKTPMRMSLSCHFQTVMRRTSDSAGSSFPADRSSDCPLQGFSLKIHRSLFLMRQPPHLTMRVKK